MTISFRAGDCLDVFGAEPDASFDAFVSDWPAGVAFMSRAWDRDHGGRDAWVKVWAERAAMMRRKAKPGAYSLTWALPRTSHWTACALDDGGWQIQDVIVHVFGQGWPKGRSALKPASEHWILARNGSGGALQIDAARVARGDGVPTFERGFGGNAIYGKGEAGPQKATGERSYAGSWPPNLVLSHCPECEERGTRRVRGSNPNGRGSSGEGNISASSFFGSPKAATGKPHTMPHYSDPIAYAMEDVPAFDCLAACDCGLSVLAPAGGEPPRCACGLAMGWACPVAQMDRQSGTLTSGALNTASIQARPAPGIYGDQTPRAERLYAPDSGGASRFFPRFSYNAKAAGGERHAGCDDLYWRADKRSPFGFVRITRAEWESIAPDPDGIAPDPDGHETIRNGRRDDQQPARARGNVHPTVKGLALMEWLVSLVCPPGGRLGDITAGSGGTGIAVARLNMARDLGASFLGADICPEAVEIAEARLAFWQSQTAVQEGLFGERTVIEPEAVKPSAPKLAPPPKAAPPADPRQGGLFQ